MSLTYASQGVAKEYGRRLWPLLLSGMAVAYEEKPPPDACASLYSQLCEDLAALQTRLLQLVSLLSPSKLDCAATDDTALVEHVLRMLHHAPVSATTNRDMLVSARQILASGLKLAPDHHFNAHIRSRILSLLDEGRLFSRQRVDSHQYIARQVVIDIAMLARKQLTVAQLDTILDVFCADLQNERLPITIQFRVAELIMRFLEHLSGVLRLQVQQQRPVDPALKPLFCKCLSAILSKIDSLEHHVRRCAPVPRSACPSLPRMHCR
jgi:hypothetical protein